jgi:hypothetical protein
MGRVYKARHLALDRDVAVKLVDRAADGAPREAALAEARAAAKLEDPRIVAVYEVGEDRGFGYIVMQWVDGESLESRVRRAGPLAPEAALAMARDVAGALSVAHAAGVVHRDVKPANILMSAKGAKLSDFGLAAPTGRSAAAGSTIGSFHFMPPEQGRAAPPDPRMDLYALGATWYYALTGLPPFDGAPGEVVAAHREQAAPDVRRRRPQLTARTAKLIRRLMEKEPALRPADGAELARELADPALLLEVDSSGSPFRLNAPAEPAVAPADVPAAEPKAAAPAPRPVPAPPPSALGSRARFYLILLAFGLAAVGWPWRLACAEDWLAACAFASCAPLLLTYRDRLTGARRALGAALWLASLLCAAVYARGRGAPAWTLETLIAAGFGVVATGGSVYLGYWGVDTEEAVWSRVLAPVGAALTLAAALTWSVPDTRAWLEALGSEAARWWGVLASTEGGWRWGGLVALACALAATRRLRTGSSEKPKDRRLNWTA